MAAAEFTPQTTALLERVGAVCGRRGVRLTELRRQVLGLVLDSDRPAGAYDLLEKLRPHHRGAAPPTVYRALDFLLEQGLIHKVERLSAFVGCLHGVEEHDDDEVHHHAAQFLICRRCGQVTELNDREIGRALLRAARGWGFALSQSTVEAEGICEACSAAA